MNANIPEVGFIGLGSQGGPMAERIAQAGLPLTVWARRSEALTPFKALGASAAASVEALGVACDAVCLCVVDDAGTIALCDELIPSMRPGSLLIIHATVLPETCIELAQRAAERDIALIDAPVSGGGIAAAAGKLTVMCGGTENAFERARPIFETFADMIVRLGNVGAGQMVKLVNNAMFSANMAIAHNAFATAETLNVDLMNFTQLIGASSGRSFAFDVYAQLPSIASFTHGGALQKKDMELLLRALPDNPGSLALSAAAAPLFAALGMAQ